MEFLRTWHKILFAEVVPLSYYAGNFRGTDARRPCLHYGAVVGGQLGEPPETVEERMQQFSEALRLNDFDLQNHLQIESRPHFKTLAKIGLVAWAMGTFVKIHPFANGNGRIARLLVNNLCYRYELPMPFRHPSRRPLNDGYGQAGQAAMTGDFNPTFQYILRLLEDLVSPY